MPSLVAAALFGAMLGFAPFNKPVARLFLGDVGSLPIGLMLGWLLLQLAGKGHLAAALILPLYYLADATITLACRIARGEPIWQAHRTHFYQRATDNGFSVPAIVARVLLVNLALAALAVMTVQRTQLVVSLAALAASIAVVSGLLGDVRATQAVRVQAASPPKSGTASRSTPKITERSSRARPCSSAASQPRIASSDGLTGLAATMPSMPIGAVGSSRANSISCRRSPGRMPVKVMSMSRPGSRPESRIIRSARSTIFTGWPMLST